MGVGSAGAARALGVHQDPASHSAGFSPRILNVQVYVGGCTAMPVHAHVCTHRPACAHTRVQTHSHVPAHTCAPTCTHMHTPAGTCICLHTLVHTCTHMHMPAHVHREQAVCRRVQRPPDSSTHQPLPKGVLPGERAGSMPGPWAVGSWTPPCPLCVPSVPASSQGWVSGAAPMAVPVSPQRGDINQWGLPSLAPVALLHFWGVDTRVMAM